MPVFQAFNMDWKGAKVTIAPNRLMQCIAMVEEVVTVPYLSRCVMTGDKPYARLSMALGIVLRYAGVTVTDEEIYAEMFNGENKDLGVNAVLQTLLMMMFPPEHLRRMDEKAAAAKKAKAGAQENTQAPS